MIVKPHIVVVLSSFLIVSGCQLFNPQGSGRVVLPPDVAGTWKAREQPWKIVLNPDGTVASAVIDMGMVEVKPNKTTKVEMKDGSWSTFTAGDCVVEYTPDNRELYVSIEMKNIHVVFVDNVIDGNSVDRFVGPVSEDGKQWTADWIKLFDYGPQFPQEPNDVFAVPVVFDRVEE